MARLAEIGSYDGAVQAGDDLLELIFDDIKRVADLEVTNRTLRHVTIVSDEGNRFEINGFPFEVRNNIFATPTNGRADLMTIRSFRPLQNCNVMINYIR